MNNEILELNAYLEKQANMNWGEGWRKQLVTVTGYFECSENNTLTDVDVSSWVPADGTTIIFQNDALSATSVELILRRLALAGVTTCTIILIGGTNAAYTDLSAQGQSDANALHTAGNNITMNGQPW